MRNSGVLGRVCDSITHTHTERKSRLRGGEGTPPTIIADVEPFPKNNHTERQKHHRFCTTSGTIRAKSLVTSGDTNPFLTSCDEDGIFGINEGFGVENR